MKKKIKIRIYSLSVMGLLIILLSGCKEEEENNPPTITTFTVTSIGQTSATCGGDVTAQGTTPVTARGVCWSTSQSPTINDSHTTDGIGIGSFTSIITGLTSNTPYYVRAYATNSNGTGYGSIIPFETQSQEPGTFTDIDGNVYHTVIIGTQEWMVENLTVTRYRNGDTIPNVTGGTSWGNLSQGALCEYENTASNGSTYGKLYNGYAVKDSNNLAPVGWHMPTDAEWTTLINYLGGQDIAGGKLKETGTTHWQSPNEGATNETGFTALPGGYRNTDGVFYFLGYYGYWWSSSGTSSTSQWYRFILYGGSDVNRGEQNKVCGFSVRCIKD